MQKRKGFTLVELLVVVAVILVLVGILLPVLGRAREKARRVNCAGNLKSLGLAMLMYSADNGGYFMPNPDGNNWWQLGEYDYVTMQGQIWACPSAADSRTNDLNSNYYYIGSGLKDDAANASETSLAYDASGNHPGNRWMNLLFVDGHADGFRPGRNDAGDENPGALH